MASVKNLQARLPGYCQRFNDWSSKADVTDCGLLKLLELHSELTKKTLTMFGLKTLHGPKPWYDVNIETVEGFIKCLESVLSGEKMSNLCGRLTCDFCSSSAQHQLDIQRRRLLKWFETSLLCDSYVSLAKKVTQVCCRFLLTFCYDLDLLYGFLKIISLYTRAERHCKDIVKEVICNEASMTDIAQCRHHGDADIRRLADVILQQLTQAVTLFASDGELETSAALQRQLDDARQTMTSCVRKRHTADL